MKIIGLQVKSDKAATARDITTGVLIFVLFTSVIFTLYLQIYKQSSIVKIHQDVMGYAIQICEDIDLQSYENTEDLEAYKEDIISRINFPEDRYVLNLQQEKYIESNQKAEDIVKKIIVNISYTFDNEERSIELKKLKVKE